MKFSHRLIIVIVGILATIRVRISSRFAAARGVPRPEGSLNNEECIAAKFWKLKTDTDAQSWLRTMDTELKM